MNLRRSTALAALALCSLLSLAPGQAQVQALASALVRAQAPAIDDPDATAMDLLAAIASQPRSPLAALLAAEVGRLVGQLQVPARVLAPVEALSEVRQHGLLTVELTALRWRLQRAVQGPEPTGPLPLLGHADSLLVCGPLGDAGDNFVGLVLAPELQFPRSGDVLSGRGMQAITRTATRHLDSRRVELSAPPRFGHGCYYGLWRVQTTADVDGFLEVDDDGDWQLFVDGEEVHRVERWRQSSPARAWIGMQFPAGGHDIVIKTASNGRSSVAMRVVDGDGSPLAQLLAHDGKAEFVYGTKASRTKATFITGDTLLTRLATTVDADPIVQVAALIAAVRDGHHELAIDLSTALRRAPPSDDATALAFARVLRTVPLPDELRKAEASVLEERAAKTLLPAHHTARMAVAQHKEEQDQREDALRLLAAAEQPGPETFARRADLLRQLRFQAELLPLLQDWAKAWPQDSRPLALWAQELQASRDGRAVLAMRQRSLALRPDQPSLAQNACRDAVALLDVAAALALLAHAWPSFGAEPTLGRLRLQLELATAQENTAEQRRLVDAMAAHSHADANLLTELAAHHERCGHRERTVACLQRCLEVGGDRPALRAWLARLTGTAEPTDELLRFRRDGKAAIAAFQPSERDQRSSMTVVLDQHMLMLHADGSWMREVHSVRRINDQAGVEAFSEGTGLGNIDEVLLLRTLGADGSESVPPKIDRDYTLQRLVPGAFVEWRYREHGAEPGAGSLALTPALFGSADEPSLLTELVLVLPSGRGELRTRALAAPSSTATLADGRTVQVFTRTDLATLAKERFTPSLFDLVPCAEVGEDQPLAATLRDHAVQLGRRTRLSSPLREQSAVLTANCPDALAKANAIWTFCHATIEDGQSDDALQTLLRKKGSRFLLAVALLRAADLTVLPLACRDVRVELSGGTSSLFTDSEAVQMPAALLLLAEDQRLPLFVDTPRHWPLGRVPASRAGTMASILHGDHIEPFLLPSCAGGAQSLTVRGSAVVSDKTLVLTATAELGDEQGFSLAEQLRQLKDNVQKQAARQIAQQMFPGWRIESAAIADMAAGQPLRITATCKRACGQRNGDRFVVPLPLPPTKFVATFGDRSERTLPWQIGADIHGDWRIELDPGPDLQLAQVPTSTDVREVPMQFSLHVTPSGGKITCERYLRIGAATRPAVAFADWLRALTAADRAEQSTLEFITRTR